MPKPSTVKPIDIVGNGVYYYIHNKPIDIVGNKFIVKQIE